MTAAEGDFAHFLVTVLDLGGTFVFAVSGAIAAVNKRLDLFGILVIAFVAGNFGGVSRDVFIGAIPPAALNDPRYIGMSVLAGTLTFFWYAGLDRFSRHMEYFDAAGLALFAVAGANKALMHGLEPGMAALLGMLTGIGGGMTRDVILREIPSVLKSDFYAIAALAGASVVVIGHQLAIPYGTTALVGGLLCFGLRVLAIRYHWHLPVSKFSAQAKAESDELNKKDGL